MKKNSSDIAKVYEILKAEFSKYRMPVVDLIECQTNDPFKVLVTTIMSARTKDETTSLAAKRLFEHVNSIYDLQKLTVAQIQKLIYPVGFYRDKALHLKNLPEVLISQFNGEIPSTVEELITLPGVGRKTANLVVAIAFNKPAVCVDIHVHRIFNRLGYLKTSTPFQTEMQLRKWLPVKYWTTFNSFFVSYGQHTCRPVKPHCEICPIFSFCSRVGVDKN